MSSGPGDRIRHPRAYVSSGESHDLMFSPRLTFWSSPQPSGRVAGGSWHTFCLR
ncbi:unnamed protein product [Ectocarpus sp. 13 AM-2016]